MPHLVADDEIDGARVFVAVLQELGIEHDEVAAQEAGRERVEEPPLPEQVRLRHAREAELLARGFEAGVELRELRRRDENAVPLNRGEHQSLRHEQEQRANGDVHQANNGDGNHEPDHDRHDQRDDEERPLILVTKRNQIHEAPPWDWIWIGAGKDS